MVKTILTFLKKKPMSIMYTTKPIADNISENPGTRYMAVGVSRGVRSLREICEQIEQRTSLSSADVVAAVVSFKQVVESELLNGYSVALGDLGIFSTSLTSEPMETEAACTPSKVRVSKIRFRPSMELKQALRKAEFERRKTKKKPAVIG